MFDVTVERRLPADPTTVWATIGDFNALADWHPAIAACRSEGGGHVRRLTFSGGGEVVEWLVEQDEQAMNYTYLLEQPGPLPVQQYMVTLEAVPATRGETDVMWSGQFEPSGDADQAQRLVTDVFQQGLNNLKTLFQS